ncbi:MAG: type II toxin-antitoxin system RelE/ParE family toxin [Acidobacteria bacterium]|nr:type II toxin-antitoxin system RelE/ParE family toxin [Acidobacteriota bacterium]MBI3655718.1 type II toxin-antitoxin system RelE/ParE family toxin [Acidobacteriota bacterium]
MYRIEITATAKSEIQKAYDWYGEHLPAGAERWLNGLLRKIETRKRQPARCPRARESDAFAIPVRQILYGKRGGAYRALFQIINEAVFILHVRHAARADVEP